jgi:hypothetical protein
MNTKLYVTRVDLPGARDGPHTYKEIRMRNIVVCQNYMSPQGTLASLSYLTDKSKHIIRFETENGDAETVESTHPDKDKARDHWREASQLLTALGFKRFMK